MTLSVRLLGPPALCDGVPLAVDTRKATALLAYLAVEGGATIATRSRRCSGRTTHRTAPARRCAGRSRRCARRSAGAGSTVARDSVSLDGGESARCRRVPPARGERRPRRSRAGGGAPPRPVPRRLRAARQRRLRRLAVVPGGDARARARRASSTGSPTASRGRRRHACARSSTPAAGSRSTRSTRRRTGG